jgi:endonuclease YncB( thermonuclease family)
MSRIVFVLAAGAALCALSLAQPPKPAAEKPATQKEVVEKNSYGDKWDRYRGKVTVVNGRTLRFADGTEIDLNIEYPKPDEDGSKPAVEFLKNLIGDQEVTCFQGAGLPPRGPKARWMAYVGDTNIEHALVINGWALGAHSGTRPAEMIAREKKRGLWADK